MKIRIATRKSPLARWQTQHVVEKLKALYRCEIEYVELVTEGDVVLDRPLAEVGGKALFVKELERALWDNRADIAVHSMKDVPNAMPEGFAIAAILEREDPRDAFLSQHFESLEALPEGAVVGTSSYRREAQLLAEYPALKIKSLRGNVDTRVRKLKSGEYDAIILAAAGLKRLGLAHEIKAFMSPAIMVPGAGQGAIGIECLGNRGDLLSLLAPLKHATTHACVSAERAMNLHLAGNCYSPIGSFAELFHDELILRGIVASRDGKKVLRAIARGPIDQALEIGIDAARDLLAQGAEELLVCTSAS